MNNFKKIDNIKEYVQNLIDSGNDPAFYVKTKSVFAQKATIGEKVITKVKSKDKGELIETTNVVHEPNTWKITDESGEMYLIKEKNFHRLYGEGENQGRRTPLNKPRKIIQINESIEFIAPWEATMRIEKGGWLCIDNMDAIYGINPEEFD